jgi:phage gpG-like protein
MLNVTLTGDKEAIARFEAMPDAVHKALLAKVTALSMKLQAKVVQEKLSGQVLKRVTGKLARSIHNDVQDAGTRITGIVGSSGDVKYAGIHEFGFSGPEQVKEHQRTIKEVFGRAITPKTITIRAYTRQMNMPQRSYLRSSLGEMKDEIVAGMTKAAQEAFSK